MRWSILSNFNTGAEHGSKRNGGTSTCKNCLIEFSTTFLVKESELPHRQSASPVRMILLIVRLLFLTLTHPLLRALPSCFAMLK
ncbi:unnamed protein product [Amoebophrya sp. A25]|nr:unnamed protein product [Amoebophrya sp. A25]|eukprot:GSA25T00001992001.1